MVEQFQNPSLTTAVVFPGIGIQLSGDERGFYCRHKSAFSSYFEIVSNIAGKNLTLALDEPTAAKLSERDIQYLTFAFSAGMWQVLRAAGIEVAAVAGNSFGLYAALYAAGVVSFSDGFQIINKAYECLARVCRTAVSARAIIGLTADDINTVIMQSDAVDVRRTNTFNETCHVVCGPSVAMEKFAGRAIAAGAINVITLNVSFPYHHETLAAGVSAAFEESISAIQWQRSAVPVVSTMGSQVLREPDEIRTYVIHHLTSPIDWHAAIRFLYAQEHRMMIECGPGISLTQNARFVAGNAKWVNVKNIGHRLGL